MSNMLRKSLIPAELVVASSLLLAPIFTLTGFGQNNPANQPANSSPVKHPACQSAAPADTPPASSAPASSTPDATRRQPTIENAGNQARQYR